MKQYKIKLFANNNETRTKGLMFTDPLDDDECALFSFPRTSDHSFWNKNVSYPLRLVFCDSQYQVIAIKNMDAESTRPCKSGNPGVKYVIEAAANAMDEVQPGDFVIIDNEGEKLHFINK